MTLATGTRLGRYEIRSHLGAGGMGEVYLAQDTKLDRKVAIKILHAEVAANQDRRRRFEQEAKAAAALNHPNIAHIHEVGSSPTISEGVDPSATTSDETHFIADPVRASDCCNSAIYLSLTILQPQSTPNRTSLVARLSTSH